ncbi:alpha-2-macroglobulin family protein [Tenacibaculum finnmarkense]|uniref:alpha-2-macroglobulin family protein n=1 Tax=Tenacibaculum finnmarkense TaxID=2781243 RepID=UPI000C352BCD|nr:MG2 domain-containing protein [Tenacibaculum finnmarkense]MCD8440288.1 alpha-2-macroglobulin [Tenacibaculum finnmarkense genomovar ulcerans]MCG8721118.1 alpha-2-macroglobulin [Tenacibaculum finnmarkense]SOS54668.1 Alpha-2-macroglobulin [Tenacibaculum finnmarkense]
MKKIKTLLFMITIFSGALNAQENYNGLWEDVAKFEQQNLPKSALKVVETIYAKADVAKNSSQIIKALFYKSKFSLTLEEDAQLKIINQFKIHIDKSSFPTKNVLENVLANLYWQYFNQNKWKFYNRTKTSEKVDNIDFRTWDLDTLFAEIHTYYQKSLENKTALQQTDIREFKDILYIVQGSKEYRPSLFDFLAHNALDFYKTSETNITKPNYQFKIDNSELIGTAKKFTKIKLVTKDATSLQFNALKIHQELINFHLKNKNLKALATVDLERLNFVNNHAIFNDKQDLFLQTLKSSEEKQQKNATSGLYSHQIAEVYRQQANSYQPNKNEDFRFKNKEALAICDAVISKFPKSVASQKCKALKGQITNKSLSLLSEKFSPINTASRLLITYNNIDKLYFTAYKIDKNKINALNNLYKEEERINFIKKLTKVTSWNDKLRNEFDYKQHTTEVIVPKLPQDNYLIVAHENSVLNTDTLYATANIQVSNLVLIENTDNNITTYQVVNRNTGKPIENAQLLLQNNERRGEKKLHQKLITDKNGFATYISNDRYYNVSITVTSKNDTAIFGDYYLYKYEKNTVKKNKESITIKPFIFTDRSIYRPGQTVYFKTILIQKKGEKNTSFSDSYIEVTLNDVNGQKVKTLDLKLNEFGSASGEIILPNTGLTGEYNFSIRKSSKEKNSLINGIPFYFERENNINIILVEEYKRPKFETDFKPVTQTFKVNDIIIVNGFAKAFSGANVTDAKVVYRVHRKVQYPSWWYWRGANSSVEAQEITHGETVTDASGNFYIQFKAIPDLSTNKESLPVFNYEITADITDVNGETRSTTTIVNVGYHALLASLQINSTINKEGNKDDKQQEINITTNNLNGQFTPSRGTVKIYKLQAPKNPLRKRPWNTPDYQDISENEFNKLFPHDAYSKEEINKTTWKKGAIVFEESFDTQKSKKLILKHLKNWTSGAYIAVLNTTDKFNQKVTDKAHFNITSTSEEKVADNQLFFIKTDKKTYTIDETVCVQIGSASKDMTVIVEIEKDYKTIDTKFIHLNNEIKNIEIPVHKEDVKGFAIKYYFVNYNSFDTGLLNISVENEQENISIETNTFRDKLQPGTTEKWSFTIKNDKKNKVTAEVLASMYDASLDEFKSHNWSFNPIRTATYYSRGNSSSAYHSFGNEHFRVFNRQYSNSYSNQQYDKLKWFGFRFGENYRRRTMMMKSSSRGMNMDISESGDIQEEEEAVEETVIFSTETDEGYSLNEIAITSDMLKSKEEKTDLKGIKIRKNLQETAFFYPHLTTDKKGNISFSFTTPEALTKWKLQLLAHTKEALSTTKTLTTVTQKELMITTNAPRFLREGDNITLSAKISNLSEEKLAGISQLILTDAITGKEIQLLDNSTKNQNFSVASKGNTSVSWNLAIPDDIQAVQYKIVAKAGDFSDGEQNVLPVLSNRMLVTETLPMWIRSNQTKTFTLDKLKNNTSKSLKHHKLTLEITSNPAWYAVQALPYLMEYPYECSEQTFARYYANTLASFIANSNPKIQEVFKQWKSSDALLSNLEKNQELKSLIIQETPWLRDAQSETEQKKRIALLFDLNKMKNEQENAINKLQNMQMSNGGFPWFKGGNYPNTYITQHIASGFGHLKKLGVSNFDTKTTQVLEKAVRFLDAEIAIQYADLLREAARIKAKKGQSASEEYLKKNHLSYATIQYLYMRSFYPEINVASKTKIAISYYKKQSATFWKDYNLYAQGQISLIQFRNAKNGKNNSKILASKILKSLKENSITSDELGMYWKNNVAGYYSYQAPIETQSLLIEAFSEIENDTKTVDNLKIWLLKNKQTNRWKTTKATTEAVYALLLQGSDWLSITDMVDVKIGNNKIEASKLENVKVEAGTGYFKTSWNGNEITPNMSEVTISKKGKGIAWGGLYWQYFEDLDKITSAETPLKLRKNLFKKITSDTGKELIKITDKTTLKVGDLITVRIELRCDRNMEFVHMKDMRASGVEPINVLSQYKSQDNLYYYEATKDASTNFFFDRLPKGVFVFEYDVRVNNAGNFSNGITTIQNMYAPEFSSHSKGERLVINN